LSGKEKELEWHIKEYILLFQYIKLSFPENVPKTQHLLIAVVFLQFTFFQE
jgi:hypothetical protein